MKRKISEVARLNHMIEAIENMQKFTRGLSFDQYMADLMLQLAIARLFEILGEASRYVTDETKTLFSDIEWNTLYTVRNIVAHEYFGVNYEILWNAMHEKIPALKLKIEFILLQKTDADES